MSDSVGMLREAARRLLEEGTVQVVIGFAENGRALFARRPDETEKLTFGTDSVANLTVYLKRKEVKALGKAAIVVKPCDERALVVLETESQVDRSSLHVIGMACGGVGAAKCARCDSRTPRFADEVIGTAPEKVFAGESEPGMTGGAWEFWKAEFERCTKCYACRQVCPLCYCERCIVEKNRPTVIDPSPTLKGNFAWQITRAFHLAGRCIGCGECTRACPAQIRLDLLNRALADVVAEEFGFRPGMDPATEPVFGAWSQRDKEDFIR